MLESDAVLMWHTTTNEQPLGSARSLGTDELKSCQRDKQRGETIKELGDDEPQVGVILVDRIIVLVTFKISEIHVQPQLVRIRQHLSLGEYKVPLEKNGTMLLPVCGVVVNNQYDVQDHLQ